MPINISGTWRDTKAWWVNVSGTWREGTGVFTKVAGVWREEAFSEPLTAVAVPDDLFEFDFPPVTTAQTTCTPSGGVPPYSFLWVKVSGTTLTVISPTSAVTAFRHSDPAFATYRCQVTDDNSTVAFSNNVTIEIDTDD